MSTSLPVAELTTLRLGGPASDIRQASTPQELIAATRTTEPLLVIGGGSNLVVGDAGFPGTVVVVRGHQLSVDDQGDGTALVTVDAGMSWDDVVAAAVERGLSGIEFLSGIPGSAGATPIQNVGAYGVEIESVLAGVRIYDRAADSERVWEPSELRLTYRDSLLKHSDRWVVLTVTLRLRTDNRSAPVGYREVATALGVEIGEQVPLAVARETVLGLRRAKGMVLDAADHDTWSAGSFFTNPIVPGRDWSQVREQIRAVTGSEPPHYAAGDDAVKLSAAWLIERAGFVKGYPGPDARVRLSTKHTLALTNRGHATTADLLELAREVREGVHEKLGVVLSAEPIFVGCSLDER